MGNQRTQSEIVMQIAELVEELGWVIGLPDGDGPVDGLVIGTREYVEEVVESYYGPGFVIYEKDEQGKVKESPPSKKITVH